MSAPLVSVIIPTRDRGHVLPRALNSVFNQTFADWELWIVDDGSVDSTQAVIKNWLNQNSPRQKVHILSHSRSLGVSAARNRALFLAQGQWVAFLDSDDEWLPNKLGLQIELGSDFSLVHGEEIWVRNGVRVNAHKKHKKGGGRQFSRCVDLCCISPSAACIRRDLLINLGGFREDFPVCEDYELWLRICSDHDVGFASEPVVIKYGGHEDQLSTRFKAMDYHRVKALVPFLNSNTISTEELLHVARSIEKRCHILLNGYRKHNQTTQREEVETWLKQAELILPQPSPVA